MSTKNATLEWRGSVTDLATDLRDALTADEQKLLGALLYTGQRYQHQAAINGTALADMRATLGPDPAEKVDHPPHYNQHLSGVEAIVVCERLPFNLGTAWKYLFRAGHKPGEALDDDLHKTRWYIARETQRKEIEEHEWKSTLIQVRNADRVSPLSALTEAYLDHRDDTFARELTNERAQMTYRLLDAFDAATHNRYK